MVMNYNIDFEVASSLFTIVLAYYVRLQYNMTTAKNKSFFRMLLLVIITNVLDVVSSIGINHITTIPYWFNMILSSLYFATAVLLSYQFLDYALKLSEKERWFKGAVIIERVIVIVYALLLAANLFTGIIFDLVDYKYVHGPLYILVYIVPYSFLIYSAFIIFLDMKGWMKQRIHSLIIFYVLCLSGVVLQLVFFPNVLLSNFTLSLGVVIILFAMETQDYQHLVKALENEKVLNEKTQIAVETKRRFIDNISENIRVPVKNIIGNNEKILKMSGNELVKEIAKDNQEVAVSLMSLLDAIMDYSEADLENLNIASDLYDVKALVDSCIVGLKNSAYEKNIELSAELDKTLPTHLYGDRDRITQVLRELVKNAITNTDEGYVRIKVTWKEHDKRHILLLLSVEDSGRGIRAEMQDTIFDAFEGGSAEDGGEKRIGLGLALAKRLVEAMNGDIGFYSNEGKGTLFYIEFPQKIFGEDE